MRTGHVEWFDIRTPRPEVSAAFYSELFGWRFEPFRAPGGPDGSIVLHGDREIGLLTATPQDEPAGTPSTVLYVFVEDLAATVDRAAQLGGRVVRPPTFIDVETGANAELADPTGVIVGVWANELAPASS